MANVRNTQIYVEVLVGESHANVRSTQTFVEVLAKQAHANIRYTQTTIEVLQQVPTTTTTTTTSTTVPPVMWDTQQAVEIGVQGFGKPRSTQTPVEIGVQGFSKLRSTQVVVEIAIGLWTTTSTITTSTTVGPWYVEDVVIGPPTTTTTTTSTTEPPFVGSTTTTTTTSTTEPPITTTTTTTSTTAPPPFDGLEWGEETPYDNVDIHPWRDLWQGDDGSTIMTAPAWETVGGTLGRSQYGQLILYPGVVDVSDVKELPDGWKTLTVEKNRYGSNYAGYVNVWVRGSTSTFSWDEGSPSWSLYTSPVYANWTYAQLKVAMSLTGTTTSTT